MGGLEVARAQGLECGWQGLGRGWHLVRAAVTGLARGEEHWLTVTWERDAPEWGRTHTLSPRLRDCDVL